MTGENSETLYLEANYRIHNDMFVVTVLFGYET